jgi:hypothetical protein
MHHGSVFSVENFHMEISAEKSQRFKKITIDIEKFKYKFLYIKLFISVKSKSLINTNEKKPHM